MGDSKTDFFGYQPTLLNNLDALGNWDRIDWMPQLAAPGWTSLSLFQQVPAWTAAAKLTPDFILVNIGINDAGVTTQANYETWLGGALDTAHAKWPFAKILVMRVWGQGHDAQCDAIDDVWIPDVLSTRPWAVIGPDERIVLKDGDNGASRTIPPGIHPNTLGYQLTAAAWQMAMGY